MDIKDNKLEKVKEFLKICTDEYIISLANKGLLKRSRKEIDKGIHFSFISGGDAIKSTIGEEFDISIGDSIDICSCSCPAKTVCKHIIMGILLLKEEFNDGDNYDETKDIEVDGFSWIKEINIEEIIHKQNLKDIDDMHFRMKFNHAFNICVEESISVEVEKEFKVVIPKNSEVSRIVCSCGEDTLCNHKVESLIAYLLKISQIQRDDVIELFSKELSVRRGHDFVKELLHIEDILEQITRSGLVRLPYEILSDIEVRALICGEAGLPHMEKMLKGLRGNLQDYFDKRADFSNEALLRRLTRISLSLRALRSSQDENLKLALMGEKRSRYISIGELSLMGLGADRWKTKSGYEGVTYYFYSKEYSEIYTYSDMAGTDTLDSALDRYNRGTQWNMNVSMKDAVNGVIRLKGCMVNKKRRISSSANTEGDLINKSAIEHLRVEKLEYDSWDNLVRDKEGMFVFSLINSDENEGIVILKPERYGAVEFDKVTQRLRVELYDQDERVVNMFLTYSNDREKLFSAIEDAWKRLDLMVSVFGRVYKQDREFCIYPISFYYEDGSIVNIHLDG